MDEKLKSIVIKMMEDGASQESIEGVISAYKNRLQQSDTESGKPNVVAKEDVTVTTEENLASGDGELQLANPLTSRNEKSELENNLVSEDKESELEKSFKDESVSLNYSAFPPVNFSEQQSNQKEEFDFDQFNKDKLLLNQESTSTESLNNARINQSSRVSSGLLNDSIEDYQINVDKNSLEDYVQINLENNNRINNISPESFNTYEVYSKEKQNLQNKKNELSIVIADKSEYNDYNKLDELSEAYSDLKLYKPEVAVKLRPLYLKAEKR